jgi:PKD repeat protein
VALGLLLLAAALGAGSRAVRLDLLSDGNAASPDDGFGASVAVCELNGDGIGDIVVGAPQNDSAGSNAGAVYIFLGRSTLSPGRLSPQNASFVITGPGNDSLFGSSVAAAGDWNGDSRGDLLVGAPGYNQSRGAAFLFLGSRPSNGSALSANVTVLGPSPGGRLGASLAGAGDLNGDGLDDIACGAPGAPWNGEVRVFFGQRLSGAVKIPDLAADVTVRGPRAAGFGSSVAGAGDLNGDGTGELAVAGKDDRVFVYFGSGSFADDFQLHITNVTAVSQNQSDDTQQYIGNLQASDDFYYVVMQGRTMFLEDFPTAGMNGTIHSAQLNCVYRTRATWAWWNDFTATNYIRYSIAPGGLNDTSLRPLFNPFKVPLGGFELSGPRLQNGSDIARLGIQYKNNDGGSQGDNVDVDELWISVAWSRLPNVTVRGDKGSEFGAALAPAGDQNGDGFGDLLVGAPGRQKEQGAAFVVFGGPALPASENDTQSRLRLNGTSADDRFGASVASGRISLDDLPDIVAGAPGAGRVYLFNGTASPRNLSAALADEVVEGGPGGLFGAAVASGDANGLGRDEVLVGAPASNLSGRAAIYENRDERTLSRPLSISYLPPTDPRINETEDQPFGLAVNNPTNELAVRCEWYLDGSALPGETGTDFTFRSTYTSAGDHNVTVIVSDGERTASHRWNLLVTDVNAPPAVDWQPAGDVTMDEGTELTLRADAVDFDGDPLSFAWSLDGVDVGADEPSYVFRPDFDSAGVHRFACTVDDQRGHVVAGRWTVTVQNMNRPPEIDFVSPASSDLQISEGGSVQFTVAARDPDGGPVTIMWHLGAGLVAVDSDSYTFRPDFRSAGTWTVRANVSDGELAASHAWSVSVLHVNAPPVIDAFGPEGEVQIDAGQIARFWVRSHDPNGDQLNVSWLVDGGLAASGDLSFELPGSEESPGAQLVQALLSDGANSVMVNWTLLVNHAPRITNWNPVEDPTYIEPGREAFFFVTPVDPDNDPLALAWYLDGRYEAGVLGNSARFSLGPSSPGSHRMMVVVSDGRLSDTRAWTVVVNGTAAGPPVPRIEFRPAGPRAGEDIVLSARASSGGLQLVNFTWDLGDGTLAYGAELAHRYADAGIYTVRLTVTDARGNRATATADLAIGPDAAPFRKTEDWGLPLFVVAAALAAALSAAAVWLWRAQRKLGPGAGG